VAARASVEGWLAMTPISKAEGLRGPIRRNIPSLGDNSVINIARLIAMPIAAGTRD